MTPQLLDALNEYINKFCVNGIFAGSIIQMSDKLVKVKPGVFCPWWGGMGYHFIDDDGRYMDTTGNEKSLDRIIEKWDNEFKIETRRPEKVNYIKGYHELLDFYVNNLPTICSLDYIICNFHNTYDISYLNVFDNKRNTEFKIDYATAEPDLFINYEENYYKMIHEQYNKDIACF